MAPGHRPFFFVILAALCCFGSGLFHQKPVYAKQSGCSNPVIKVNSETDADTAPVCAGAEKAVSFLTSQGFTTPSSITIELVDEMPETVGPSPFGAYFNSEKRILILRYAAFEARRQWFRIPVDQEVYRALVSHEVAHAVASHNFTVSEPSLLAQEYIAYVAFFSALAPAYRNKILGLYPRNGDGIDWQIRDVAVYLVDPLRFGANAYRHFLDAGNGSHFLKAVLSGAALAE